MRPVEREFFQVMIGAEEVGHSASVIGFVETFLIEADAESFELALRKMARGKSGDGRGIDPAAQEDSQRHIRYQTPLHGAIQEVTDLLAPFLLRVRGKAIEGLQHEIPIAVRSIRECPRIEFQGTASCKFENVFVKRKRSRNVAVGKIFLQSAP